MNPEGIETRTKLGVGWLALLSKEPTSTSRKSYAQTFFILHFMYKLKLNNIHCGGSGVLKVLLLIK